VQLPASIADRRLLDHPSVAELSGRGCEVHVRSVFMQGLWLERDVHFQRGAGLEGDLAKSLELLRRLTRGVRKANVDLNDFRARAFTRIPHGRPYDRVACSLTERHTTHSEFRVAQPVAEAEQRLPAVLVPVAVADRKILIEAAVPHGGIGVKGGWKDGVPNAVGRRFADSGLAEGLQTLEDKHPAIREAQSVTHLGSLGGGNHFIEICLDEQGFVWFMLHSGSRGVGNAIAYRGNPIGESAHGASPCTTSSAVCGGAPL